MIWRADGPLIDVPDIPKDVHDWPGVAAIGLWVIAILGGAFIVAWHRSNYNEARTEREAAQKDRADLKADAKAIRDTVVNGHDQGLRDDLDDFKTTVAAAFARFGTSFSRLESKVDRMCSCFDRLDNTVERLETTIDRVDGRVSDEKRQRYQLGTELRDGISKLRDLLPHQQHSDDDDCHDD